MRAEKKANGSGVVFLGFTKKQLERHYAEKYPEKRRGFADLAIFNIVFSEMDRKLLDVGCGFGEMMSALKAFNFDVKGITATDYEAKACREKGLDVISGDAGEKLPFKSAEFESVTMLDSIEHMKNYANALRECCRVLRKGGKVLVYTPNREVYRKHDDGHLAEHEKEFSAQELKAELEKAGFSNVRFLSKKFFYPKYFLLKPLDFALPKAGLPYLLALAEKA
ncbi:MAG: class I SAM-dependent methyltransferase [Candidatus Diapherotrites archaeon]|nr:class I SAM-dependent methyltransferase [Candidatus Diapherotrites archaeon]